VFLGSNSSNRGRGRGFINRQSDNTPGGANRAAPSFSNTPVASHTGYPAPRSLAMLEGGEGSDQRSVHAQNNGNVVVHIENNQRASVHSRLGVRNG